MNFNSLSSVCEEHRLGRKDPLVSKLKNIPDHELRHASTLLFGEGVNVWSYQKMITHIAKEMGMFTEVVSDIASTKKELISNLSSESIGNGKKFSLTEAANTLRIFSQGETSFMDCAKLMNQIEAKLFWSTLLGARKPITKETFIMNTLRNGVTKGNIIENNYKGNDFQLNKVINIMIHTPHLMSTDNHIIYKRRPLKRWTDKIILTEYNNGYAQLIEGKGNRVLTTYDDFIIEHTIDGVIYDVYFFDDKELELLNRLDKLNNKNILEEYIICFPKPIPSWMIVEEWAKGNTVRFPNMEAYEPHTLGGYMLVLNDLIRSVRISHYYADEISLKIGMEILDGTDFMLCGEIEIQDMDNKGYFYRTISKYNIENQIRNERVLLGDDVCIVMDIVSPSFDTTTRTFRQPTFLTFDSEKGIGEISQLVDVMV